MCERRVESYLVLVVLYG